MGENEVFGSICQLLSVMIGINTLLLFIHDGIFDAMVKQGIAVLTKDVQFKCVFLSSASDDPEKKWVACGVKGVLDKALRSFERSRTTLKLIKSDISYIRLREMLNQIEFQK